MEIQGSSDRLALVLSGGGARAAYQVGVLSAMAEMYPALRIPIITGVSAGAINASYLAANTGGFQEAVAGLQTEWGRLVSNRVYAFRYGKVVPYVARTIVDSIRGRKSGRPAIRGFLDMSPLRSFLKECVDLSGIDRNLANGKLIAAALSATSYSQRATVTFVQGSSEIEMWRRTRRYSVRGKLSLDHVMASVAIPLIFEAVCLDDAYYGDGSIRQTAPLAPSIHLGAEKIIAISMRRQGPPSAPAVCDLDYPSAAELLGVIFNSVFIDALDADAERLDRINGVLQAIPDGTSLKESLRPIKLLLIRPSQDLGEMARGVSFAISPQLAFAVRAMGGRRDRASDFLSYLMFDPAYTTPLMELGYRDAMAQSEEITSFIEA